MQRVFKITVNGSDYDVTVNELTDVTSQIMPQYRPTAPVSAAHTQPTVVTTMSAPASAAAGADDVCAQMGGVVATIMVKEGQAVTAGDRILELEAMKMKVPVIATRSGTVSRIGVKVGDSVDKGQPLLTLA